MYPRLEQSLSLGEIAEDWALDLPQRPPLDKIRTHLVQAFWRGELRASLGREPDPGSDPRFRALDILRLFTHPFLLVIETLTEVPPIIHHPDGSLIADVRTAVMWPRNPAARDGATFRAAIDALAGADWDAYDGNFHVMLRNLEVSQEDFRMYCEKQAFALPGFWFHRRSSTSPRTASAQFRRWLEQEVKLHPTSKPKSKAAYQAEAMKKFPGLSERSFNRIWGVTTPKAWQQPGRLKRIGRMAR